MRKIYEELGYQVYSIPTEVFGLTKELHLLGDSDHRDWIPCEKDYLHHQMICEFSDQDKSVVKNVLEELKETQLKNVMEIGIARSVENSSTLFILEHKGEDTKYVGVDMTQTCVEWAASWGFPNTFPLLENSQNTHIVKHFLEMLNIKELDFLHIDGNHSTSHVYNDFKFAEYVRKGGYVMFHDTNYHPGPSLLLECIDTTKFEIKRYFVDEEDWGVTTLKRI